MMKPATSTGKLCILSAAIRTMPVTTKRTFTVCIVPLRPTLSNRPPRITRPMPLKIEISPTTVVIVPIETVGPTSLAMALACDTRASPAALSRIAQR